eukprot:TRINITY_DN1752_c2_g1_i1.p1 TRINITY_DN1752_c2_g1~~TRINITY_DN1752_c2_g1_i1.p1  ORF type:complete len:375 (-),score=88.06 TRINITY_DN1752_c2_g1_i1:82-1101(-)
MDGLYKASRVKRPLREEIQKQIKQHPHENEVSVKVASPLSLDELRSLFIQKDAPNFTYVQTPFNASGVDEWQPNFSDTRLGCGWNHTLGGQEELLFEHSSQLQQLYMLAKDRSMSDFLITRQGGSPPGGVSNAIIIQNLSKDCHIDVTKEFPKPGGGKTTVYGDWFEGGPSVPGPLMSFPELMLKSVIEVFPPSIYFNVYCMTAPSCMGFREQPVMKSNIEDLFSTAFTSYNLIKDSSSVVPKVMGGYWGAGIFMNHPRVVVIVQLMAAQMAGVNFQFHDYPAQFYPGHYKAAKEYFDAFISPQITQGVSVGEILDDFYSHVRSQGWKISKSNPVPNAT